MHAVAVALLRQNSEVGTSETWKLLVTNHNSHRLAQGKIVAVNYIRGSYAENGHHIVHLRVFLMGHSRNGLCPQLWR